MSGGYSYAKPGSTLRRNDIRSTTKDLGLGIKYQPIQSRSQNLDLSLKLSGLNTNSDILKDILLTQDRIRVIEAGVDYNFVDSLNGGNVMKVTFSRGLNILNSSKENDLNLSRAEATPDFATANISYIRQQLLFEDFIGTGHIEGQISSDPLYSAEEFGYGGQTIGRAYDPSEILGDNGISGAVEVRYMGFSQSYEMEPVPYVFYDIGRVWNLDTDGESLSAASAGFGLSFGNAETFLECNLGVAWPLTKPVDTPLYGNGESPRFSFQVTKGF